MCSDYEMLVKIYEGFLKDEESIKLKIELDKRFLKLIDGR